MNERCPTVEELARALAQESTTEVVDHVASCSRCADEWNAAVRLRSLVRALPAADPPRERVAALRARIVAEGGVARRVARVAPGVAWVLVAAAAVALFVGLRRPAFWAGAFARRAAYHGVVTAASGARYVRRSAAPDEVVELEAGRIHVEVSPLGRGERFRVRTADGEVEVRGTAFDVVADDGYLSDVVVQHGRVEVRSGAEASRTLGAGESWQRAPRGAAAETVQHSAPVPAAPPSDVGKAPPADTASSAPRMTVPSAARRPAVAPLPSQAPQAVTSNRESMDVAPAAPPTPAPTVVTPVPHTVNAPSRTPTAPADDVNASAPSSDDRERGERDEMRRERREERRERSDERRMR
ncbi:MAG TPA: FecR domain-containing protein [Polyangiaceae bacterium]|nr:FecR domain-containing protein [Polyangiaceae bacterium]